MVIHLEPFLSAELQGNIKDIRDLSQTVHPPYGFTTPSINTLIPRLEFSKKCNWSCHLPYLLCRPETCFLRRITTGKSFPFTPLASALRCILLCSSFDPQPKHFCLDRKLTAASWKTTTHFHMSSASLMTVSLSVSHLRSHLKIPTPTSTNLEFLSPQRKQKVPTHACKFSPS